MEQLDYNPAEDNAEYNPLFNQSMQSFRSYQSGATVLTQNNKEINKMVKQEITADQNLDEYLEKLLEIQRRKTSKLTKEFQENNEGWKEF